MAEAKKQNGPYTLEMRDGCDRSWEIECDRQPTQEECRAEADDYNDQMEAEGKAVKHVEWLVVDADGVQVADGREEYSG